MLCVQAGLGRCTLLRADSRVYRTCELLSCRLRFVRAALAAGHCMGGVGPDYWLL